MNPAPVSSLGARADRVGAGGEVERCTSCVSSRTTHAPRTGDPFRYREGFSDADTGLLSFGRRWYDPRHGRWISQDPLLLDLLAAHGDPLSARQDLANLYLYVGANPLNRSDPTGLGPGWWDRVTKGFWGKVFDAYVRGRQLDPKTMRPRGSPTEQVEKASPKETKPDAPGSDPESEPAPEPGAGEGSRAPSTERTYHEQSPSEEGGVSGREVARGAAKVGFWGTVLWGAWEGAKWTGAVLLAPETGGASLEGAALLP